MKPGDIWVIYAQKGLEEQKYISEGVQVEVNAPLCPALNVNKC